MIQYLIGLVAYSSSAVLSYSFKDVRGFYLIGCILGIVANLGWLSIARTTHNPSTLLMKGLYWDAMITAIYVLVPFMVATVKLTPYQIVGGLLILTGIFLTKV